jgi:ribosomal protein S18 acetylase RimI-like enzyme
MKIREYEATDLEACRELWRHLTQRHRDIYDDPTIGGDDPGPYFDEHYLKDPRFHKAWVADADGDLVGLVGMFVDGDEAELEPIVVRPTHRDRAIGEALAKQVIAEARALGKRWVNVRPVGRNVDAIRFFRRAGFEVLGRLELSAPLSDDIKGRPETDVHGVRFRY